MNGIELVRRVRRLVHREHTPIIMLSANDVETEARQAGVDAFLRKPEDTGTLTTTVMRLLARDK